MTDFASYSEPPPDVLFAPSWTVALTFGDTLELDLPARLAAGSLVSVAWQDTEPTLLSTRVLGPSDLIPHVDDILPIFDAMAAKYKTGSRGVKLTLKRDGQVLVRTCHFQKVR